MLYLEERRLLATFTVNSTGDSGTGSGTSGDLRYCINQANANNQANSIVFDSSVFGTAKTIALTGGQLELSDTAGTQTITGPAAGVTISGGGTSRVFQIDTNVSVGITGLTITQGNVGSGSGGGLAADGGGTVNVVDCTFSQNTASSHGGALGVKGNVQVVDCTFEGNVAGANGGAIDSLDATISIQGSTFDDNTANSGDTLQGGGGAISVGAGTVEIVNSTFYGNAAPSANGGAINSNFAAAFTVEDSTVDGNTSGDRGGGIYTISGPYSAQTTLSNSIVAGDSARSSGPDISGAVTSQGHNLVLNPNGASGLVSTDIEGVDPKLAPLGNYGGPTQTLALLPGSPAIGGGVPVSGVTTDQRGYPRPPTNPDIGAYQTDQQVVTTTADSGAGSLRQALLVANAFPPPSGQTEGITFDIPARARS